ncbi:DUF4126 domain-containing protein [Oscillatoria sp. FACHB-1407]|uniref:DUF4126 domain-containing protein n=1 Tax=Oscillatoria sp. FACHB-1407 TaxID=2692847 RepID=UPI00168A0117|nr:DUF4126 domain-containing protein [Oscillatoria sp. FACHB-1407]MBD2460395.1 DUF4126 domain-containing protein [Oscillatoria sp. FACHB-1407]
MIEVLAALSLSAAAGVRIALPLLLIGLLYSDNFWANVPILSQFSPQLVLGVLVSWSLIELLLSKEPVGQRFLQIIQLLFSPIVGAIAGITVAVTTELEVWLTFVLAIVGGLLALVLQLVQVGWSYRLQRMPLWVIFLQDFVCVSLVLFALDAPRQGGLIALLLLWLAIRSSKEWQRWYEDQASPGDRSTERTASHRRSPRRGKQDPD